MEGNEAGSHRSLDQPLNATTPTKATILDGEQRRVGRKMDRKRHTSPSVHRPTFDFHRHHEAITLHRKRRDLGCKEREVAPIYQIGHAALACFCSTPQAHPPQSNRKRPPASSQPNINHTTHTNWPPPSPPQPCIRTLPSLTTPQSPRLNNPSPAVFSPEHRAKQWSARFGR
ncbi:hypothetical protein N431DRAFT_225149 [Stipitochalara longipes BDJ]|nr:hypothetical protein N431DRAFT_225149 [Stipitochalara longipes BDJ]